MVVDRIKLFLKEMESGSIAAFAPENAVKIVDVSKKENEDDAVSDLRTHSE
jgi:hypothetical protein